MTSRSSSPPPPNLPLRIQRKRASTKVLLGEDYQTVVTKIFDPPNPGKNKQDYDEAHLKAGLQYADSVLRSTERKLSPIGMRAVKLYKEAVIKLLSREERVQQDTSGKQVESAEEEWLSIVRTHEQSIQYLACLHLCDSSDSQALQDELLKLQRTSFYARYGDFFADTCRQLRQRAEADKVLGWETLVGKYWTDINEKLEAEKKAWKQVHSGKMTHDQCPTHMAIFRACLSTGFDVNEMLTIVNLYATRNEIVHADLAGLIKQGKFDTLKHRLHDDFCDIPRVVPANEPLQMNILSKLLKAAIRRWFIKNPNDSDNVELWVPTAELEGVYKKLQDKERANDVSKQIKKAIVAEVSKRFRDEARDRALVETVNERKQLTLGLTTANRGIKRVSSAEYKGEIKKAKAMQKDWDTLIGMASGVRKYSEAYKENYGELAGPPDVVLDSSLDESS